jgi:hypothetical protein
MTAAAPPADRVWCHAVFTSDRQRAELNGVFYSRKALIAAAVTFWLPAAPAESLADTNHAARFFRQREHEDITRGRLGVDRRRQIKAFRDFGEWLWRIRHAEP